MCRACCVWFVCRALRYDGISKEMGMKLDPNHSHYIFVDDGSVHTFKFIRERTISYQDHRMLSWSS